MPCSRCGDLDHNDDGHDAVVDQAVARLSAFAERNKVGRMQAIHFDARRGDPMPAHEARGVIGFISWRRLGEVLLAAGELKRDEQLLSYQVDERGLSFRVE